MEFLFLFLFLEENKSITALEEILRHRFELCRVFLKCSQGLSPCQTWGGEGAEPVSVLFGNWASVGLDRGMK